MGHLFKPSIPRDICEICGGRASGHRDGIEVLEQGRKTSHPAPPEPVAETDFDNVDWQEVAATEAQEVERLRAENLRLREALASAVRASGIEESDTAESVRRGFVKLGELAVAMVAARDVLK